MCPEYTGSTVYINYNTLFLSNMAYLGKYITHYNFTMYLFEGDKLKRPPL